MHNTNEYAIIAKLLTRAGMTFGASIEDLLDALAYPEKGGLAILIQKLASFEKSLRPLGLTIRYNPIEKVFYIDTMARIAVEDGSILPDRLASTLLIVITLAFQFGDWVPIKNVKTLRKKAIRGLRQDLKELEAKGYIEFDDSRTKVRPGFRVPFEIDYETFFGELLKVKIDSV